ncbi:exodeoxyribonuclease 1 [Zopfia rhizophila CBS 207.26]|uniref:Exodeoxyribonuclease 1 n=1 Tax=Zopfia rhizophila CBS 207.26 TaxID=1314779 RepID=A0A6A6D5Q5_9PEZI|nr:exodeoxyribonuclease 1 [Zopfia rhizophila CBS 207.26]
MGISGLLPLLKSIHKPCNLKKFAGQTIGVDAYGWLHRGTVSCAIELAQDKPTKKYVDFAMNRVRMLVHFGITPYLVFDGDYLPSKAGTEKERAARRKESKRAGLELLKVGKTSQAHLELQKAVDVTPEMARLLIEELKHHNIQYVVAPYEADSQLAYLERKGIINGILSEDSDLLVFGAKCLITKLDQYGDCVEINRNHFTTCREISLTGWTDADFRRMAILSGCDYLPGIGKMGLKTAYRMLRKHKTVERVIKAAQFDGQFKVPQGYFESFTQAERTFLYQWVFCPLSNRLVNLTEPETGIDLKEMPYIGKHVSSEVAIGVSRGELNPHTKERIVVEVRDRSRSKPMRPPSRTSSVAQTPDLKQTKSIDTFFKPKRTPLAELDPNSFTPSPSQQALLEQQNNNGWAAVLAPQSHSQQRSTSASRTAPQPARRAFTDSWTSSALTPNPFKRQRLCSDSEFDVPEGQFVKTETSRSRFFASSIPDPSPSMRPAKKNKKEQNQDFNLWSDDSIEEAMAALPDFNDAPPRPMKKIAVFKDDFRSSVNSDSQSTTFSRSTVEFSQDTAGTLTPATSCGSPAPEAEGETVFSTTLSAEVKDLRAKFSCHSASSTSERPTPATVPSKGHQSKTLARTLSVPASSSICQSVAKGKRKSSLSKVACHAASQPAEQSSELEDSAWASMEAEVVVPASDTEGMEKPEPGSAPTKRLEVKGSEDLLVPDSEAESDCSPRKPMLDLGRFAFIGS